MFSIIFKFTNLPGWT